jgi:hypothetical protein
VVTGIQEIVSPTIEPNVVAINVPVVVTRAGTRTGTRTETRTIVSLVTRGTAPGPLEQMIRGIGTLTTAEDLIVELEANKIGLIDLGTMLNSQEYRNRINSRLEKRVTIKGTREIASAVNKNVVVSLLNQQTLKRLLDKISHQNLRQPKQRQQ